MILSLAQQIETAVGGNNPTFTPGVGCRREIARDARQARPGQTVTQIMSEGCA
jgi:hypothetical protein